MKVNADTNVLVRLLVSDDPTQAKAARKSLAQATTIVVTVPTFCEIAWVLAGVYSYTREEIANAFRNMLTTAGIQTDRSAVERGIALLEAGGDFADGAVAEIGLQQGAEVFLSFDRKAVKLLEKIGIESVIPA